MIKYPLNYRDAREKFIESATKQHMTLEKHLLDEKVGIDIAYRKQEGNEKLIVVSTGLHGIEGYVGNALVDVFFKEFFASLKSDVYLIHGINPIGMLNYRRVNENNVDLNRNFIEDISKNSYHNQSYQELDKLLNPSAFTSMSNFNLNFYFGLIKAIMIKKPAALKEAVLKGQYHNEAGIFFGGDQHEKSTKIVIDLFKALFDKKYRTHVHLDIHTGYGPRYQMSVVNSTQENRTVQELKNAFAYPLIVGLNKDEFYEINGDMIEYLYGLKDSLNPECDFYGAALEFGTLGDGLLNDIKSLKTMVLENLIQKKSINGTPKSKVEQLMKDLYLPDEEKWKEKCELDFKQILNGVIKYFSL